MLKICGYDGQKKLEFIERIAGENQNQFVIDKSDLEYLFDEKFDKLSSRIYCHKCDDANVKMTFDGYHLNITNRCVEYFRKCKDCNESVAGCYAIIVRLDKVIKVVQSTPLIP